MTAEVKNTTVATGRTAVNQTILTGGLIAANKIFGWDISLDDLVPFIPAIPVVAGVFYRISRAAADKWPAAGYILFGTKKTPINYVDVPPANPEG